MIKTILFFTASLVLSSHVNASVKFSNMGITDDNIANSIRHPRPPSISNLINTIQNDEGRAFIKKIDLNGNNITLTGATQFLEFVLAGELPRLRKLDLSFNQLRDWRGMDEYKDFEATLKKVLKIKNFESIDLRGNGIASLAWFEDISFRWRDELTDKIKWSTYQNSSISKIKSIPKIPPMPKMKPMSKMKPMPKYGS